MTPTIIASTLLAVIITLSVIDGLEERRRELRADKLRQQETTLTGQAASEALHEQSAKLFWWYDQYSREEVEL